MSRTSSIHRIWPKCPVDIIKGLKPDTHASDQKIIAEMSREDIEVLVNIGSDIWYGIDHVASITGIPYKKTREILHLLRREGLIQYGHLVEEDTNYIAGSGYYYTNLGRRIANKLGVYDHRS